MTPLLADLASALAVIRAQPPEETPLGKVSAVFLRMAGSYLSDGRVFSARGDNVNAHASAAYAFGWIDAGIYLGVLTCECPAVRVFDGAIPDDQRHRLLEKTGRYERLLCEAIRSLAPAPDSETPMYGAAVKLLDAGRDALEEGRKAGDGGETARALGWYSYGFGWLDAGVQAGLFSVVGSREIFTV